MGWMGMDDHDDHRGLVQRCIEGVFALVDRMAVRPWCSTSSTKMAVHCNFVEVRTDGREQIRDLLAKAGAEKLQIAPRAANASAFPSEAGRKCSIVQQYSQYSQSVSLHAAAACCCCCCCCCCCRCCLLPLLLLLLLLPAAAADVAVFQISRRDKKQRAGVTCA